MNWIDKANKLLEEQRAKFQESLDNGDANKRVHSWKSGNGAKSQLAQGKHNFQESSGNRPEQKPNTPEHQFKWSSAGGKAQKGTTKPHAKIEAKKLDIPYVCEYCNKKGRGIGNFKKNGHYDGSCLDPNRDTIRRSTRKKFDNIHEMLPDEFSIKQADECCFPKFKSHMVYRYIHESGLCKLIHKGKGGNSKDVSIYKKVVKN